MAEVFTKIEKARGGTNNRVVKRFDFENPVLGKEMNIHLELSGEPGHRNTCLGLNKFTQGESLVGGSVSRKNLEKCQHF